MPYRPLRFVQVAGLGLDRPLRDTGPLPDDLKSLCCEAGFQAWERTVDLCLERDVDFLLLSGNTFVARDQSLRAEVALRRGAERLAERGIPLVVVPDELDPVAAWDDIPFLPDNVNLFRGADDAILDLTEKNVPYVALIPIGPASEVDPPELAQLRKSGGRKPPHDLFLVGVHCLSEHAPFAANRPYISVNFLATTPGRQAGLPVTEGRVHAAPPAVPWTADDTTSGLSLVEVNAQGNIQVSVRPVSPVVRRAISVDVAPLATETELVERMARHLEQLSFASHESLCLVNWSFCNTGPTSEYVSHEKACKDLLDLLAEWSPAKGAVKFRHLARPEWQSLASPPDAGLHADFQQIMNARLPQSSAAWQEWVGRQSVPDALPSLHSLVAADEPQRLVGQARQLGQQWLRPAHQEAAS